MRITSGTLKGRTLFAPKGTDIRPASDKVRQAVFNSLLSRIDVKGASVLDGFCGTGSYGLEALSRGASHVLFIDKDTRTIQKNIDILEVYECTSMIKADILKMRIPPPNRVPANLIFLDPPYRKGLLLPALQVLKQNGWVTDDALFVLECEKELSIPAADCRLYGDVQIIYYKIPV